jgi:hypothetical protein
LHFVLFEKTEVPRTLPIPIWKHSAKFANVLKTKDQGERVFSLTGEFLNCMLPL